jgi:hypothetical protein
MHPRRLLVIGSQCDSLNRLDFLPEVAVRLHALLSHSGPGGCEGVALEGRPPGLLLDPTVAAAKKAIKAAVQEAAGAGATLVLAYVGHGEFPDEMLGDFYLMPKDAAGATAEEAVDFTVHLKDCLKGLTARGSLVVLLDTCHAGAGAWQAMKTWAQSLRGNIDFELLTATDDRATANAPLTRAVIELLECGDPEAPQRIRCQDVHRLLQEQRHPAQHVAYNPDDASLSLGRNPAHDPGDVFWQDSPGAPDILSHTWYFQPTPQLAALVEASRSHPVIVLTGEAGAGKTSLAAALARPELTGGAVPPDFVHAVAVLTGDTTQRALADDLERQLRRSLPEDFAWAFGEFGRRVLREEREKLEFLLQKVLRPLAYLPGPPEVRVVLDGFDQLPAVTREKVSAALAERPGHLRLILTALPDTPGCPPGHSLAYGRAPRDDLERYLASRRVPAAARPAILDRADGHWLVASLLAQAVLNDPAPDLARLPGTVNEAYAKLLDQAGAADAWAPRFRPVLGPLAVAGTGPVLPLPLLAHACEALGGPKDVRDVRDALARLRGLVVRRDAGDPGEHAGLFHTTLAEYLLSQAAAEAGYALDAKEAHGAVVRAIDVLAPVAEHHPDNPLHRYAFLREADHLWALGDMERLLDSLRRRDANSPRENLELRRRWLPRFRERFEEDDAPVLALRSEIAHWTGEAGDAGEALRLFRALLPDQERALGYYHRATLLTRNNIAYWTGETGDRQGALRLFSALLPDRECALGPDDPDTLTSRNNLATLTGATGNPLAALRLSLALLPDQARVLGRDHPETLKTRHNIAHWTGETGEPGEALRLARELLPDQARVMGRDHPDTLKTFYLVGFWAAKAGKLAEGRGWLSTGLTLAQKRFGAGDPLTQRLQNLLQSLGREEPGPGAPVTPGPG